MNRITLFFKDKTLESKFNKEEISTLVDKLLQIVIAFIIAAILGLYFWFSKGNILLGLGCVFVLIWMILIYYYMIYQRRFLQYITYVLGSLSLFCSNYQLILVLMKFDFPVKEQRILQDAVMLSMIAFQIHNNFLLNTCQYLLFILFRIYISFEVDFSIVTSLTVIFSILIIQNDYQRIRTFRNNFLLKEYNNNQLKMLENLEQPIIVLQFQEKNQRLMEYFVNTAFKSKVVEINSIDFIKNCLVDKKNALYSVIVKHLQEIGSIKKLEVRFGCQRYLVNSQIYQGQQLLISLEFIKIKGNNVQAKPYFYKSLLRYVQKHNKIQYKIELMKNICGFLLYRPNTFTVKISFIQIKTIINIIDPLSIQQNIDNEDEYCKSNIQLLNLFFYLFKKSFNIRNLIITKQCKEQDILYQFELIGQYYDRYIQQKSLNIKYLIMNRIINLIGLDDLVFTSKSCKFTLIDIEDKFLVL